MIIECVPNFSEGRRPEICRAIRDSVRDVRVLDLQTDPDHNRCVLTFVGETADALEQAAVDAAAKARELIDLRTHAGEHPRMGALDVCPFVPIREATLADCEALAKRAGRRIGEELQIPVFLYGPGRGLATLRSKNRQFEQLRDVELDSDFGPRRVHPSAGCTAVGARNLLIAYNVNLDSDDLELAKRIAGEVRRLDGIKALGMMMKSTGRAQVSMNVTDYRLTSMHAVFREIEARAKVHSSEIVGLVPEAALKEGIDALKLEGFDPDRQILEKRL